MLREWLLKIPYIQHLGYVFVFFAAFLEALPAVGLFVPGQTIVVLAGFLAHQEVLSVQLVLGLAVIGAILGDGVGYFLGRRYGTRMLRGREGVVKDISALLRQHPVKTLIIGRFNSITRAFAPFAAGASRVRTRSFILANILGSILWGACFVGLGYLFGASYELISQSIDKILLIGALIFSGTLIAYYYLKKHAGVSHRATVLLIVNVLAIVAFIIIVYSLLRGELLPAADASLHAYLSSKHTALVDNVAIAATNVLQLVFVSALTTAMFLILWRKSRRDAALFAFTVVSGLVLDKLLKELFMRSRPVEGLLAIESYAFPSGHAMISTLVLGAFVLAYRRYTFWKRTFVAVASAIVVLVSLSRLYVGVHWLSDVLGGVAFGLFWLTFVFLTSELYDSYREDRKRRYEKLSAKSG